MGGTQRDAALGQGRCRRRGRGGGRGVEGAELSSGGRIHEPTGTTSDGAVNVDLDWHASVHGMEWGRGADGGWRIK